MVTYLSKNADRRKHPLRIQPSRRSLVGLKLLCVHSLTGERRLCDRRYHGGWTVGRLAQDAGAHAVGLDLLLARVGGRALRRARALELVSLVSAEPAAAELVPA